MRVRIYLVLGCAWFAALNAGCSGGSSSALASATIPYAKSGTRIHALGYAGEGVTIFRTLRDMGLNFNCAFAQGEAGEVHCAPTKPATLLYLDANCQEPVAPAALNDVSTPVASGDWVRIANPDLEAAARRTGDLPSHGTIYRVGEQVFAGGLPQPYPNVYTWDATQSSCIATAPRYGHQQPSIYRLIPVSDSVLAKAEVKELKLEGGLTLERLVSNDGAEISAGLQRDGQRCVLQRDGKCAPTPLAEAGWFVQTACVEAGASGPAPIYYRRTPNDANTPAYSVEYSADESSKVYELSASEPPTGPVYRQQAFGATVISCPAVAFADSGYQFFRRGREISDNVPKLDTVQFGSERLRPAWYAGTVVNTQDQVLVQYYSPRWLWGDVDPTIATADGKQCAANFSSLSLAPPECGFGVDSATSIACREVEL